LAIAMALGASDSTLGHGYYRGYWGGFYGPRVGVYWGGPWYWGSSWYWGAPWYGYASPYAYPYSYAYPYRFGYPYAYGYPAWGYARPAPYVGPPAEYVEPAAPATSGDSWYYCSDPPGYFPHVRLCSKPWLEVAPFSTAENAGRPRTSP
jgi:hypothetical protein